MAMALTDEQRDWLTLALLPGLGTTSVIKLLARFRSTRAVLTARLAELEEVVGPTTARRITQYADLVDIDRQERLIAQWRAWILTQEDAAYPLRLAEIYDPPLVLFGRGTLLEQDDRSVAIVGTRRATSYGLRMAARFAGALARRGVTVVSGMASGIDAAAHRAAIEAGGRTIAVLGCGVDQVYPRENAELMDRIIENGCVLSQFPMEDRPSRGHFPYRNRIISGMTMGTLVVEAPARSGALITARQAADQGREVFALPGRIDMPECEGPHRLIQNGAKLVMNVEDILEELEPIADAPPPPAADQTEFATATASAQRDETAPSAPTASRAAARPRQRPEPAQQSPAERPAPAARPAPPRELPEDLSSEERRIIELLGPEGSYVDEIAAECNFSISTTLSSLTMLQLKGLVDQLSGKRFVRK